jgi:glycosyltransferase involved in cell wall biosynthesis
MAAKNYARFLPEAVNSLLSQTFSDWELLIIDDGSTDATPAAVRPYLQDARIHYHKADQLGQPRAKNLGITLSRGPYVAYLDADDVWEATKLEKQLAVMNAAPQVGVCFTRRSLIDDQSQPLPCKDGPPKRGVVLEHIFQKNFVCFSSVMLRRTVFEHLGMFEPEWDLAIDYDLWLRVARHYEFDFVDEALVRYRTGHGNLSKKLSDRVTTALGMTTRAVYRRGLAEVLPKSVIAEGYSSTCLALAYTLRSSEPGAAARWYWRALQWPGNRKTALRGLLGCVKVALLGKRVPGSPENAAVNR